MSRPGDDARDRLIAAAAELCTRRGFSELSEEEIAALAGVPLARLHSLFPGGKEDCLAAAQNANVLEVVAAVGRAYSADRSEWENVVYGVREILQVMSRKPAHAYLGYVFSRQMAAGRLKEVNETGHQMLEAMLERGWEYSRGGEQPAKVALGILGGAQALVRREIALGRTERLPELLPDCVYIATVPFLGQRQALRLVRDAETLLRDHAG
jgi:AcrR family transcriptional regulator